MQLEEVYFNYDPSSASHDALTICRNGTSGAIVAPEWRRGLASQPAAYARDAITGQVNIKAAFSGGPPNSQVKIRAVDGAPPPPQPVGCAGIIAAFIDAIVRAFTGNILGAVGEQLVSFNGAGVSAATTFPLVGQWLTPGGFVSKRETLWKWQMLQNGTWVDFDSSDHTIYVVLGIPQAPWVQTGDATQLPWADALDLACVWGLGAKTLDDAAALITSRVNRQSNESYTPMTMFGAGDYQLASYMTHVAGGAPFVMNCTDSADAVTTLSNLLGCTLAEGRFYNMQTKPFLALAGDPANPAAWVTWSWGYHEICWLNDYASNTIWDGCLQLDMSNNPGVHVARQPAKMTFDAGSPDDYKPRLIASGTGALGGGVTRRRVV
jgi:hypothetical protein